jgi:uncharacterized membrane protein
MSAIALFSSPGVDFLLRWIHFMAGITWIGLLYYFNFVQGAFMAEAAAAAKPEVTTKLLPRALWWFRWAAMVTFIAGWLMILKKAGEGGGIAWNPYWVSILLGGILGTIMWFNVWFIIWPNQKFIIEATKAAVSAGKAVEGLGNRPRVALLASRTNTMLSIPMLFFMAAASHMPWMSVH